MSNKYFHEFPHLAQMRAKQSTDKIYEQNLELGQQKKRIIVMLGASIDDPNTDDFHQKFPLVVKKDSDVKVPLVDAEGNKIEVVGGWSRMRAITEVFNHSQKGCLVLVTGGNEKNGLSRSDEAKKVLVNKLGLADESVVSIKGKGNTMGNAKTTMDYLHEHMGDLGTVNEIEIVTNDFHMLRGWIMFMSGLLKLETGRDLIVSNEDYQFIEQTLKEDLSIPHSDYPKQMKKTREKIMNLLTQKYFYDLSINVKPIVVEEVLEETGDEAKIKYASLLRSDINVIGGTFENGNKTEGTLFHEYKGILDLLAKDREYTTIQK